MDYNYYTIAQLLKVKKIAIMVLSYTPQEHDLNTITGRGEGEETDERE